MSKLVDTSKIDILLSELKNIQAIDTIVGGPVDLADIDSAELELGFPFIDDFRVFLSQYGNIVIGATQICGLERTALDVSRRGGENVVVQAQIFAEYNSETDLGKKTVLVNRDEEWYILIDHNDGRIYSFDPFSGKFEPQFDALEQALTDILRRRLESYQ